MPLPTHERPNGSVFDGEQQHPEYDPAYPAGYETASTGFIMVGAREYAPEIGRFLQPDPRPTGPELQWGQLNRWAYCANDPVNASDPSGYVALFDAFAFAAAGGVLAMGVMALLTGAAAFIGLGMIFAALAAMLAIMSRNTCDQGLAQMLRGLAAAMATLAVMSFGAAAFLQLAGYSATLGLSASQAHAFQVYTRFGGFFGALGTLMSLM